MYMTNRFERGLIERANTNKNNNLRVSSSAELQLRVTDADARLKPRAAGTG